MAKSLAISNPICRQFEIAAIRITAISVAISTLFSTDLDLILVAILVVIWLALRDCKSLRFEIAAIPICDLGVEGPTPQGDC